VAILEGIPGHETAEARLQGFLDAVKSAPNIQVVASQPANWERDQGFNVFQNILQAHREIDALFACNDMMALGAIEAIAIAADGGERKIMVIGFDAVEDARTAIREGTMEASVAQYPYEMGRLAVESAACTLAGETLPENIPVPVELIRTENLKDTDEPSESQNRAARAGTPGHPLCARSG
jgi:ribose transport system substrate-binding protein